MFILNNVPQNWSNISCLKFDLSKQNLPFLIPSSIASQYDFPSTPTDNPTMFSIIWRKLLLLSLHLLQLFGTVRLTSIHLLQIRGNFTKTSGGLTNLFYGCVD